MSETAVTDTIRFERRGDVGVWFVDDFVAAYEAGHLADGEEHYRDVASAPEMDATVVVIEDKGEISDELTEALEHVGEVWSELAGEVDVTRLAYVSDAVVSAAVTANLDVSESVRSFDDLDAALEWARDGR